MARGGTASPKQTPTDWVTRAADDAIRHAERLGTDRVITCASGASPSGPIHLGNLREFLTVHFVAEEIRRRGLPVRHLHSWDDYDRFRKVPAGVDPSWAEHIGRPLSAVPDPWGCHPSWAEHFKAPLQAALAELGVEMEEVSQTERYRAGAYRDQILTAVAQRGNIERVMSRYRTKSAPAPETEEEAASLEDSVANDEDDSTGVGRPRPLPLQALLPRVRPRHDHRDVVRRRHHRPRLHLHGVRVQRRDQPRDPGRGQARVEGRLADALGRRGRRLRARRRRPRDARVVVHRRQGAGEGDLRRPRARRSSATRSSAPAAR